MDYLTGRVSNAAFKAIGEQDRIAGYAMPKLPKQQQLVFAISSRVSVAGVSPFHEGLPKEAMLVVGRERLERPKVKGRACGTRVPSKSASMEQAK